MPFQMPEPSIELPWVTVGVDRQELTRDRKQTNTLKRDTQQGCKNTVSDN